MCCRHCKKSLNEWKVKMDTHGWVDLVSIIVSGAMGHRRVTENDCLKAIAYDDRFGRTRLVTRQLQDKTWQVRSVDSEIGK